MTRHMWRYNPSQDGSGIWWVVGGAAAALAVLGVITMRSAQASTTPLQQPLPTPNPIPLRPHPRPTPAPISSTAIVRQGSLDSPTSPDVVRILQIQLKQLGYTITAIDGRPGPELQRATLAFENDAGLSPFTGNLELLLAVDSRYGDVFDRLSPQG